MNGTCLCFQTLSWAGKTSKQVMRAECAGIGSFNLLRAFEKRSSISSRGGGGKMVLESGQREELKTFQIKERMYKRQDIVTEG